MIENKPLHHNEKLHEANERLTEENKRLINTLHEIHSWIRGWQFDARRGDVPSVFATAEAIKTIEKNIYCTSKI